VHVFLEGIFTSLFYKKSPEPIEDFPAPSSNDEEPQQQPQTEIVIENPTQQFNVLIEIIRRLQEENKKLADRIHELEVENENYKLRYES